MLQKKDPARLPFVMSEEPNYEIFVLSDLHCGGRTGYLPSGCKHERGEDHPQNVDQERMEQNLLSTLTEIISLTKSNYKRCLFLLGDLVDGKNINGGGLDMSNINVKVQIEWAVLACKSFIDIIKPDFIGFVEGSPYHTENSNDAEIAKFISLMYPDICSSEFMFKKP